VSDTADSVPNTADGVSNTADGVLDTTDGVLDTADGVLDTAVGGQITCVPCKSRGKMPLYVARLSPIHACKWLKPLRRVPSGASKATSSTCDLGSYLRLIDSDITQLKAQGPSRTCNESKEEV